MSGLPDRSMDRLYGMRRDLRGQKTQDRLYDQGAIFRGKCAGGHPEDEGQPENHGKPVLDEIPIQ